MQELFSLLSRCAISVCLDELTLCGMALDGNSQPVRFSLSAGQPVWYSPVCIHVVGRLPRSAEHPALLGRRLSLDSLQAFAATSGQAWTFTCKLRLLEELTSLSCATALTPCGAHLFSESSFHCSSLSFCTCCVFS